MNDGRYDNPFLTIGIVVIVFSLFGIYICNQLEKQENVQKAACQVLYGELQLADYQALCE